MGCSISCCERPDTRYRSGSRLSGSGLVTNDATDPAPIIINARPPQNQAVAEMSPVVDLIVPLKQLVHIIYEPAMTGVCGCCDSPTGHTYDYFIISMSMPLDLLEDFLDHGWWRTGRVVFRPRFDVICCPGYATRLEVSKYLLTKKHRKVIRKWGTFLKDSNVRWENRGVGIRAGVEFLEADEQEDRTSGRGLPSVCQSEQPEGKRTKPTARRLVTPGKGADPNKPLCKKAKLKRMEHHKTDTQSNPPKSNPISSSSHISLCDYIDEHTPQLAAGRRHTFETRLLSCYPMSSLLTDSLPRAYELYDKLQRVVHTNKTRFKSQEEFQQGFMTSPLCSSASPDKPQGSYHLQYVIDGELVMYSVVDILHHYFVSIYFVYDPDIRFMCPGIFTCLYEIGLVRRLQKSLPGLKYYGLGYYSGFDDKATYKKQFKPQEVLCNETNVFVSLESVIPKLLENKYHRLAADSVPEKEGRRASIDRLSLSMRYNPLCQFRALPPGEERGRYQTSLKSFITEAGSLAAHRCSIDLISNFN